MRLYTTDWHADWQNPEHGKYFDYYSSLSRKNLIRDYESYNDVRLLDEKVDLNRNLRLLEVGCATGEFYRYLRIKHPKVRYCGIDVSEPAILRAKAKYPQGIFFVVDSNVAVSSQIGKLPVPDDLEIVYARDVVHHQTDPFEFVSDLIRIESEAVIFRCRTRDVGKTEMNPDRSCQYLYDRWAPFIIMNLQELTDCIISCVPSCELVVLRNHVILGGQNNRFIPKECYLPETGTAETAVGVFKTTDHPGKVTVNNRKDRDPCYTLDYRLRRWLGAALHGLQEYNPK